MTDIPVIFERVVHRLPITDELTVELENCSKLTPDSKVLYLGYIINNNDYSKTFVTTIDEETILSKCLFTNYKTKVPDEYKIMKFVYEKYAPPIFSKRFSR